MITCYLPTINLICVQYFTSFSLPPFDAPGISFVSLHDLPKSWET